MTVLLPRDELGLLGHDALQIQPPTAGLTAGDPCHCLSALQRYPSMCAVLAQLLEDSRANCLREE